MDENDTSTGLSAQHERALARVLDALIPPDAARGLPGGGELGLARFVEEVVATSAELGAMVSRGLEIVSALPDEPAQTSGPALLEALAAKEPGMVPALIFHLYIGYYQSPAVIEALGIPPRPPHPEGYELEPGDLGLLDDVRARSPFYRVT